MKTYRAIKSIRASQYDLEEIEFYPQLMTLEDVTYADGTVSTEDLLMTKDQVLEEASQVIVNAPCGRKVWQLSDNLKRQVKKTMKRELLV
tara:strand:+ start:285 stop:554 length:270 start_codon:yes stop_codon:yes gene_type:complete